MTDNVRVGVVGTSWWADAMYLPALQNHPHADVTAICGRNRDNAQKMADNWNIPHVYTDYEVMIDADVLDAVIICTPNDTHYPITMKALENNVHVLCEKPIALSYENANEMATLAQERGVKHLVPFTYRFMPSARYVKELMETDYIGKPYHLNMRYYTGFARDGNYMWRFDTKRAGSGVIGDIGAHFLYVAEWLYGPIKHIYAQTTNHIERPDLNPNGEPYELGEDDAILSFQFENGATGVIHVTAVCYEDTPFGQTHHMEFHGSGGTLYTFTDWDTIQQVKGAKVGEGMLQELPIPDHIWGTARRDTVHNTYRDLFRKENFMIGQFITSIVDDVMPSPNLDDGARIQRLIEACLQSAKTGQRVEIDSIG